MRGLVVFLFPFANARLAEPKKEKSPGYQPETGDWMHDYDKDEVASCLVANRCTSVTEPICASNTDYTNECVARCHKETKLEKGECGGCSEPNACCQRQKGGVTKEIEWNKGEAKTHLVCVRSKGRKCPKNQQCLHSSIAHVLAEPMNPKSGMTPLKEKGKSDVQEASVPKESKNIIKEHLQKKE